MVLRHPLLRRAAAAALVASILSAGCGSHRHPGRLVAEYPRGHNPVYGWTESRAEYVLYARQHTEGWANAVNVGDGWKLGTWRLKKRSPLGFKTVDGQLVAVAGRDHIPLPPGSYCWHVRRVDAGRLALDHARRRRGRGIGVFAVGGVVASEWESGWGESFSY